MNAKLCKKLRKVAQAVELPEKAYEQHRHWLINPKETERGFYRHLKRNVKEVIHGT